MSLWMLFDEATVSEMMTAWPTKPALHEPPHDSRVLSIVNAELINEYLDTGTAPAEPTSALAAVIDLPPAIVDEPRWIADLAEQARGRATAPRFTPICVTCPTATPCPSPACVNFRPIRCTSCASRSGLPANRGHTVIEDHSPLAVAYDTFTANPPLQEMTIQHMSDESIIYG